MWLGQDDALDGLGCPGNTCVGADGHLYEWVEGVDGLGNAVGFWKPKFLRKGLRFLKRHALPLARRLAPFVPGGAAVTALTAAAPYLRRALPYVQRAAGALPVAAPLLAPVVAAAAPLTAAAPGGELAGFGLGDGSLAQGEDGRLYQWVEGVDGLGNPIGFWQGLADPGGYGSVADEGDIEGLGDDELAGLAADDELLGVADDALDGLADDELEGPDDDDLNGFADDELIGVADDELNGLADEDLEGVADDDLDGIADDELPGVDGYVRQDGTNGLEAYLPDMPRGTPWFKAPAPGPQPSLWSPLW